MNANAKDKERKRQREKARRVELAKAFDVLGSLVAEVEVDTNEDSAAANRKKARTSGPEEDTSGLTQLEVVQKANTTMRRLHEENKTLKQEMLLVLKHQLHQMQQEQKSMQDTKVDISTPTELASSQPPTKAPRVVSNSDIVHQPVVYANQGTQNYWSQDANHPQADCWDNSFPRSTTLLAPAMCLDECFPQESDDWTSPIPLVNVDDFSSAGWTALLCLTEG
jgi:hypothetical protein